MEKSLKEKISAAVPGTALFTSYDKSFFSKDLAAGLSVAAIALPVGLAYSGLAGLPPQAGLYSCILPVIAYAMLGSSRQLIVGPDSATCILISSSLMPLAAAFTAPYQSLAILLTIIVGLFYIIAGILKLGFIANFLSKPILTGYLNGLALSIITGQTGKLLGFKIESSGFFKMAFEIFSKFNQTHLQTFLIGAGTFLFLRILKKTSPKLPSPLIALIIGIAIVIIFGLDSSGVAVVGNIPPGFPSLVLPEINWKNITELVPNALGILLISFCSAMLTSKSFAARNGYSIDANKDLIALGAANIFSGLSGGFAVSGADSRTAVNESSGGKTQMVSVFASLTIIIFILFFTSYLSLIPVAALSAIIISASIGLFSFEYMKKLFRISKSGFVLALITSLGVLTIGVMQAIFIAVGLSLLKLIAASLKPNDTILGKAKDISIFLDVNENENIESIPGILIYRFESGLIFYNADYFKSRLNEILNMQKGPVTCVILDASSINLIDLTASDMLEEFADELAKKGIKLFIARGKTNFLKLVVKTNLVEKLGGKKIFYSINDAVNFYNEKK